MRSGIVWLIAGLCALGLWWAFGGFASGPGERTTTAQPVTVEGEGRTPRIEGAAEAGRMGRPRAEGEGVAPDARAGGERTGFARAPDAERERRSGGSEGARSPLEALRGATGAGGDAGSDVVRRTTREEASDPALEQERASLESEAARLAEEQGLLSEDQVEARIDRELRRGSDDYDAAREQVLSDIALAHYLARQKAGPDASPEILAPYVDQALGLIPMLSSEVRAKHLAALAEQD